MDDDPSQIAESKFNHLLNKFHQHNRLNQNDSFDIVNQSLLYSIYYPRHLTKKDKHLKLIKILLLDSKIITQSNYPFYHLLLMFDVCLWSKDAESYQSLLDHIEPKDWPVDFITKDAWFDVFLWHLKSSNPSLIMINDKSNDEIGHSILFDTDWLIFESFQSRYESDLMHWLFRIVYPPALNYINNRIGIDSKNIHSFLPSAFKSLLNQKFFLAELIQEFVE